MKVVSTLYAGKGIDWYCHLQTWGYANNGPYIIHAMSMLIHENHFDFKWALYENIEKHD